MEGYSVKSRHHVLAVLTFVAVFLVAGWLSKRLDLSAVFCPLCWRESIWIAWNWVNAKLLQRPQEADVFVRYCESNLIQIAYTIMNDYAPKHNGFLPSQEGWQQWARKSLKNSQVLRCSAAKPSEKVSYRLNPNLSGRRLKDVREREKTVLFYESDERGYPIARHHFGELFRHCCHVVFTDGRIGHLPVKQVEKLLWSK
jgi:hypothetical protein